MITTGPGLIRPSATASVNWRSVNQWWSVTRPWCRKGTTASPEPNVSALALAKNRPRVPSEPPASQPGKALDRRERIRRQARRPTAQPREPATAVDGAEKASGEEQPDDLAARDHGRGADDRGDRPEQQIVLVSGAGELVGGDHDDRHHCRADPEEDALHLPHPLVVRVQRRDRGHEQERRHDERQRHPKRPAGPALEVAEPHRQLR